MNDSLSGGPEGAVTAPAPPASTSARRRSLGGPGALDLGARALRRIVAVSLHGLRAGLVDTAGLPSGVRWLVRLGYALTGLCLVAALLLPPVLTLADRFDIFEYQTAFRGDFAGTVTLVLIPFGRAADLMFGWIPPLPGLGARGLLRARILEPVVWLSTGALLAGWAFLLTGASDCGRRVFLLVLGLFCWALVLYVWPLPERAVLIPALAALLLALGSLHALTRARGVWRDYPLAEFAVWLAIGAGVTTSLVWIGDTYDGKGLEALVSGLERTLLLPAMLWLPVLLLGGVEAVELGIGVGKALVSRFAARATDRALQVLAVLAPVGVAGAWLAAGAAEALPFGELAPIRSMLDVLGLVIFGVVGYAPPVMTLGWVLVRLARRRWDRSAALTALTLSIASLVLLVTTVVAYGDEQDLVEWAIVQVATMSESIGRSLSYFTVAVLLLAHNVATFGARYANREGRLLIRQGRALMHFGVLLIMLACGMFFSSHFIVAGGIQRRFEPVLVVGLLLGMLLVAPAYFVWTVARRSDRLLPTSTLPRTE